MPLMVFIAALAIVASGLLLYTASGDASSSAAQLTEYDAVGEHAPPVSVHQPIDDPGWRLAEDTPAADLSQLLELPSASAESNKCQSGRPQPCTMYA